MADIHDEFDNEPDLSADIHSEFDAEPDTAAPTYKDLYRKYLLNNNDLSKFTPEERKQYEELSKQEARENSAALGAGLQRGAFFPVQVASSLIPGDHKLTVEQAQAPVERAIANLLGDEKTKELYAQRSNEDLAAANAQRSDEAMAKAPSAAMLGEVAGALPINIAGGAAIGGAAKAAQAGALLEGASPLAARAVQAGVNTAGYGTMGELQGIGQSNAPTLQERAIEALPTAGKAALMGAAIEGAGLASSAPGQAAIAKGAEAIKPGLGKAAATAAKYGTAIPAGAIALPIATGNIDPRNPKTWERAGEGGIIALLAAKYGPGFFKDTELGRSLKKQYEYGQKGESLRSAADYERVAGQAENLAQQTSKGMLDLEQKVSVPAVNRIKVAYDDALEQTGQKLGMKGQELSNFIEKGRRDAGTALEQAYLKAEQEGRMVDVGEVVTGMKDQLQKALGSGLVSNPTDKQTVANLIESLNDRLIKKGIPVKLDTTSIVDASGQPMLQSAKISGKNVPLSQLPTQVPQGQVAPKAASMETTTFSPGSPEAMSQQTLKQSQMITPEQPRGPLTVPEARELKGVFQELAFRDPSVPSAIKPIVAQGYNQMGDIIAPVVEESAGPGSITANNQKYTAVKQIGDIVGEPIPDRITGQSMPPQKLTSLIEKMGTTIKSGDKNKIAQIFSNLKVIDPVKTEEFYSTLMEITKRQEALTSGMGKAPLTQAETLRQQGFATPEVNQAGQQLKEMESLKKNLGMPNEKVLNAAGEAQPSAETRQFIENLGDRSKPALSADAEATLSLLEKYNPEMAKQLRSQGYDVAEKMRLAGDTKESATFLAQPLKYARKNLGATANKLGEVQTQAKSIAQPFINNLKTIVETNAQRLGKFAAPLQDASKRGAAALTAMHYTLYQNNPEYRQQMDDIQKEFENEPASTEPGKQPLLVTPRPGYNQ